jgi:hypothetical protein
VAPARSPRPPPIRWRWGLFEKSIDDYLESTQTTGLLILKDGQAVAERYQYDRQPGRPMRFVLDGQDVHGHAGGHRGGQGPDPIAGRSRGRLLAEIAASAYGQTTLRNLLRMSSGVRYRELYTWTPDDDNWVWGQVLYHPDNRNQPQRIVEYLDARTTREVEQGTRFHYALIETEILGRRAQARHRPDSRTIDRGVAVRDRMGAPGLRPLAAEQHRRCRGRGGQLQCVTA